jgi:hypothetical protein
MMFTEFDRSVNPENCAILELYHDGLKWALTRESKSLIFEKEDHHPMVAKFPLVATLVKEMSWVRECGKEVWFHRLAMNEDYPIEGNAFGTVTQARMHETERVEPID